MKTRARLIGSIAIALILIIFTVIGYKISRPVSISDDFNMVLDKSKDSEIRNENSIKKEDIISNIIVHVEGAVINPNTYDLKSGSRIKDLLNAAGGYKEDADKCSINPAEILKDGEFVYVYSLKEDKKDIPVSNLNRNNVTSKNGKLNINTASLKELDELDGIGEKTAQKIIDFREKNGKFKSLDELKNIGARIGDKTITKLREVLDIE